MLNKTAYALGSNRSCIRDLFEYGRQRAAIVGPENVYDYSLGNPSIPSPPEVNQAIVTFSGIPTLWRFTATPPPPEIMRPGRPFPTT